MFGGNGELPSRSMPDYQHVPTVNNTNNMTQLIWTISRPNGPTLNSTVFWTLNTTGSAPGNYPGAVPRPPVYPSGIGETLVLYHNGHETMPLCNANYDGTVAWLNQLGYDVMEFDMPLIGCNQFAGQTNHSHWWFAPYESKGVHTMAYFVEPVILAVNYAVALGYKRIVMVGLSGGGWTTTLAAAVDKRISLSFPIAGSVPFWMRTQQDGDIGDFEQLQARPIYSVANYTEMYVLAALEEGRAQVQILHEDDPCCYRAGGRHDQIIEYNENIAAALNATGAATGRFATASVVANIHQVDERCKAIVGVVTSRPSLLGDGPMAAVLPFDILRGESP